MQVLHKICFLYSKGLNPFLPSRSVIKCGLALELKVGGVGGGMRLGGIGVVALGFGMCWWS